MNSNMRIKELRQALNLSQEEFGKKISCSRDVINNYERQRANVPPPTELAIASAFGVNLNWLRDGSGEMFLETKDQFIDKLANQYGLDEFMKKVISAYSELSASEKDVIKNFIAKIAPPADPQQREWLRSPTTKAAPFPTNGIEQTKDFARDQNDVQPPRGRVSKAEIEAALNDNSIKTDDDL